MKDVTKGRTAGLGEEGVGSNLQEGKGWTRGVSTWLERGQGNHGRQEPEGKRDDETHLNTSDPMLSLDQPCILLSVPMSALVFTPPSEQ